MRSVLLPLVLLVAGCGDDQPQTQTSAGGLRINLPLVFQLEGDRYFYTQRHPLHTLWFKLESTEEDQEAFQRGYNRSNDGSAPRIEDLDVATLAPIYQLVASNELHSYFLKMGYDFKFIRDSQNFLPDHPEYSDRCAYLGYRVTGYTSTKHPDIVFVTREHSVVCVRRDGAAETLKIDRLAMSERCPVDIEPRRDFDDLTDMVFSSLRPY